MTIIAYRVKTCDVFDGYGKQDYHANRLQLLRLDTWSRIISTHIPVFILELFNFFVNESCLRFCYPSVLIYFNLVYPYNLSSNFIKLKSNYFVRYLTGVLIHDTLLCL